MGSASRKGQGSSVDACEPFPEGICCARGWAGADPKCWLLPSFTFPDLVDDGLFLLQWGKKVGLVTKLTTWAGCTHYHVLPRKETFVYQKCMRSWGLGQPRSTGWGGINVPVVAPQSVVMEAHGLLPCFHSVSGSQCPKFPLLHTEVPLGFLAY